MKSNPKSPSRLSTKSMRHLAENAVGNHTIIHLTGHPVSLPPSSLKRWEQIMDMSGAAASYCDFTEADGTPHPLIAYQTGSVRDDFDFGHAMMVNTQLLHETVSEMTEDFVYAGWYDLRLRLSRKGPILHIPESLYSVSDIKEEDGEKAHFAYVDPRNRDLQIEMERAATAHLTALGALVTPIMREKTDVRAGVFPVEASVIIPVRNRKRTVADAVMSALSQEAPFRFNVIVVDNRSTDGTSEILADIAASDTRLKIISTDTIVDHEPGIGGCWNIAVNSPDCGRFAIQLDSDDLYSSPDTLRTIVEKFYDENCGMVIGSYTLTDIHGNTLPPGLIDHAEWTDENGTNNALRINGLGAPRAFFTPVAREIGFPDVCYGEDYAMGLAVSRRFKVGRIYDSLYLCRRWEDNTDHAPGRERINRNNLYKDFIRTLELNERIKK